MSLQFVCTRVTALWLKQATCFCSDTFSVMKSLSRRGQWQWRLLWGTDRTVATKRSPLRIYGCTSSNDSNLRILTPIQHSRKCCGCQKGSSFTWKREQTCVFTWKLASNSPPVSAVAIKMSMWKLQGFTENLTRILTIMIHDMYSIVAPFFYLFFIWGVKMLTVIQLTASY